jgi:hypothetical protein
LPWFRSKNNARNIFQRNTPERGHGLDDRGVIGKAEVITALTVTVIGEFSDKWSVRSGKNREGMGHRGERRKVAGAGYRRFS